MGFLEKLVRGVVSSLSSNDSDDNSEALELYNEPANEPNKVETYAGKQTARVTKIYNQDDGTLKATVKINKDGSVTQKIEKRYK